MRVAQKVFEQFVCVTVSQQVQANIDVHTQFLFIVKVLKVSRPQTNKKLIYWTHILLTMSPKHCVCWCFWYYKCVRCLWNRQTNVRHIQAFVSLVFKTTFLNVIDLTLGGGGWGEKIKPINKQTHTFFRQPNKRLTVLSVY